jgi:hypothetical protein
MSAPPGWSVESAAAAPRHLGLQCVESPVPLTSQFSEPAFDAGQRFLIEGVEAAGALGADVGEAALAQDPKVAGDRGLGESELGPDDVDDRAGALFTRGQQLEDASADRISENLEGLHRATVAGRHYIT